MIRDARLNSGPVNYSAQLAVVGAGPAGLTLARELGGRADVLVIEGGGFENDAEQEALLTGECAGLPYPLTETRARQFGGSSALWAGYCAQFDEHDFILRDWVPGNGWPFGVEAIEPYYSRVAALLNLGEGSFNAREVAKRSGMALPFDECRFVPTVWRFGTPTRRFGECLRGEFEASGAITMLLHANVVDIRLDADHGRVTELVIRTLNGREARVSADQFVLACGGIETPRLLLNANTQAREGVGNGSGMVGRYFMEHPHPGITPLLIEDRRLFECWTHRNRYDEQGEFTTCLGLSKEVQEDERVMNARAHIYRTPEMGDDETPRVGLFMEQAPNRESRVLLSNRTDSLGMRRVVLDWRLNELDWRTHERTAAALAAEFERIGAARLTRPIDGAARDCEPVLYSNHHLGTTRMSKNPEDGVVGPECRVRGPSNLYIVGGSIFPTVSWAKPTFTVLALTLRLADHLRKQIGAEDDMTQGGAAA